MKVSLTKAQLNSAIHHASDDGTRPSLNLIRIEPRQIVACDGHRLILIPIEGSDEEGTPPIGLGLDEATRVAKMLGAKGMATLETTEGEEGAALAIDGRPIGRVDLCDPSGFPDYRQVIPKGEPVSTARFDAAYLRDLCDAAITLNARKDRLKPASLVLRILDDLSPMRVELLGSDGEPTGSGVLMPIRR